jgi:hypothetical protein
MSPAPAEGTPPQALSWEDFLAGCFPGYLLPEALVRAMPEDVALRFLARVGGSPEHLGLLRAASVVAARGAEIRELCLHALPDLARRIPRRLEAERRARVGELRGLLDAPATLQRRMSGRLHEIVSRARRPLRLPPEDVLLGGAASRLLSILRGLREAGVTGRAGWGDDLVSCEAELASALLIPALAEAAATPIALAHEQAARAASHPAYALALTLHGALRRGIDSRDPEQVARAVAEGALLPLADHTRFELAVLLRLLQALEARPGWTLHRTLVVSGRREVAELRGEGGARVRVHYDQATLDPGPYDAGLRHYLGQRGRLRPDITVISSAAGRAPRATVIEAKLSEDPAYLAAGYREAIVYRAEYGEALRGWPKAVLVTSARVAAEPRREDEVIVVGWDRWVPEVVIDGLLE